MPRLEFSPEAHKYLIDGQSVPSVTTILRDLGLSGNYRFAGRIHAYRGSMVHQMCALLDAGARLENIRITLEPPWDKDPEYVKVAGEIPGYCEAFLKAKRLLRFQGTIYECPMICASERWAGTADFLAYIVKEDTEPLVDIKSGTYPPMTIIQIAAYEDLARRGQPVNPQHPGLDWVQNLIARRPVLDRMGLQLDKGGEFRAHFESSKGHHYSNPMWMTAWRSALYLHRFVPAHQYIENDDQGRPVRQSWLSDMTWTADAIKQLSGKVYDQAMRAGDNIFNLRQQYKLL